MLYDMLSGFTSEQPVTRVRLNLMILPDFSRDPFSFSFVAGPYYWSEYI